MAKLRILTILPTVAAAPAVALPPPEPVAQMIETALAGGDAATVAAVVAVAKRTLPDSAGEIDAMAADFNARRTAEQAAAARAAQARLASASALAFWKGEVELGGSRTTGNSSQLGLYGAINLRRDGINWRHQLAARTDFQSNAGETTTERAIASWQPNYKFDADLYIFGLAQYEHDRFLGYSNRYTLATGVGYTIFSRPTVKIDLEGGPALRHTDFVEDPPETTVAGRASLALRWAVTPSLAFAQDAAVYVERGDSNAVATTSLDTKLIGALKARLSYNVRYERDASESRDPLDTISRATLVYSF